MSRSACLCIVLALAAISAGCATTSESTARAAPARSSGQTIVQDDAYVQHVESVARRRGIQVTWVHRPVKRRARDD
ncbi:MAG: hypothetical protein ACOY37_12195 [Pseudomonadota bacterium]